MQFHAWPQFSHKTVNICLGCCSPGKEDRIENAPPVDDLYKPVTQNKKDHTNQQITAMACKLLIPFTSIRTD